MRRHKSHRMHVLHAHAACGNRLLAACKPPDTVLCKHTPAAHLLAAVPLRPRHMGPWCSHGAELGCQRSVHLNAAGRCAQPLPLCARCGSDGTEARLLAC